MGWVLKFCGGAWAALGIYVIFSLVDTPTDKATGVFILATVLMILPGLAVFGIGAAIPKKSGAAGEDRYPCPHCAERILRAANVCPHCRRDLPPAPPFQEGAQLQSSSHTHSKVRAILVIAAMIGGIVVTVQYLTTPATTSVESRRAAALRECEPLEANRERYLECYSAVFSGDVRSN